MVKSGDLVSEDRDVSVWQRAPVADSSSTACQTDGSAGAGSRASACVADSI